LLLFVLMGVSAVHASSRNLVLGHYHTSSGAITVRADGDFVDPYFANRALTLANENGMDVQQAAAGWIPWLIAHQLPDGRFQRYCKSSGGDWSPCQAADADDAGLAVWLELLYRLAPDSGLPAAWQASAQRASDYLGSLHDTTTGLYFVSHDLRVSLLMDNVEVYHSLRVMAAEHSRFGQSTLSREYEMKADRLARAIVRHMWQPKKHRFVASTQHPEETSFYPSDVAQVYPWLFQMPTPAGDAKAAFRNWLKSYESVWLARRDDDFPWGMIALTGKRLGANASVDRWVESSEPLRHTEYWTVLDEALFQLLAKRPS
jgi:hypothetical protein